MAVTAEQLTNLDAGESGMAVVSRESVRDGAGEWGVDRVVAPARLPRPRLEVLVAAGPDLLAVETIPDAEEAEVLAPLLDEIWS